MFVKRLATCAVVAALVFGVAGGVNSSSGQSGDVPGVSYGGLRDFETVWLRVDESRSVILNIELPWATSGRRCSNGRPYWSLLLAGAEYDQPIGVRPDGTFAKTVVDRYRDAGTRYVERQILRGRLGDSRVTGTIAGRVRRTTPTGRIVRCTFGPLNWNAAD